jgi:hypothetical protein
VKAVHDILVPSAETIGAFNTGIDTGILHRLPGAVGATHGTGVGLGLLRCRLAEESLKTCTRTEIGAMHSNRDRSVNYLPGELIYRRVDSVRRFNGGWALALNNPTALQVK